MADAHLLLFDFSLGDFRRRKLLLRSSAPGGHLGIVDIRGALCARRGFFSGGMMKKFFLVSIFGILGACASTQTVLSKAPTQVFRSTDSATKVAFCLANKNNTAALDQEDGSKVVLIKNGYGGVSMAFSVYPEGTGSRIEYRKEFGTIGGIWRQCIGKEAQHSELSAPGITLHS